MSTRARVVARAARAMPVRDFKSRAKTRAPKEANSAELITTPGGAEPRQQRQAQHRAAGSADEIGEVYALTLAGM